MSTESQELLDKHKRTVFVFAMCASFCLVGGVPMTVIGAVKHIIFLMVLGIVAVVFGFYGTPLLWIAFGAVKKQSGLVQQIKRDGVTSIRDLANINGKNEKQTYTEVQKLIDKRYLVGYFIVNDRIVKVNKDGKIVIDYGMTVSVLCPFCGGKAQIFKGKGTCPYCNSVVTLDNAQVAPDGTKPKVAVQLNAADLPVGTKPNTGETDNSSGPFEM